MISNFIDEKFLLPVGGSLAFILTIIAIILFRDRLPQDVGRAFAVNGTQSKGKARGAGIIFVIVYIVSNLIFIPFDIERSCYLTLFLAVMFTGFFDDASKKPWGNLTKGILDFGIAALTALTYLYFNENTIELILLKTVITIPLWLYMILIVFFVFASINVVNCSDGVDGLCGSQTILVLASFLLLKDRFTAGTLSSIFLFIMVLLAYLWFNTKPSSILMGDAGSRTLGLLLAVISLKSHAPLLFIPFVFVMIIDGGLGLFKLTVLRIEKGVFKIKEPKFMKKIRTPIHDHVRKNLPEGKTWSDPQVVWRFLIIQALICVMTIMMIKSL